MSGARHGCCKLEGRKVVNDVQTNLFMHLERRLRDAEKKLGSAIWDKIEAVTKKEEDTPTEPPIGWEDVRAA